MGVVDWQTAKYADGPRVSAWISQNLAVDSKRDETTARRVYEWKSGGTAQFWCVDRVMGRYGRHVSELPDEVWLAERPPRKPHKKRKVAPPPKPKFCLCCGEVIPYYRKSDGRAHGPSKYASAKYCSRACAEMVLTGRANPPLVV